MEDESKNFLEQARVITAQSKVDKHSRIMLKKKSTDTKIITELQKKSIKSL